MSMADATNGHIWDPAAPKGWGSTAHWNFAFVPWLIATFSVGTIVAVVLAFNAGWPVVASSSTSTEITVTTSNFSAVPFIALGIMLAGLAFLFSLVATKNSQTAMSAAFAITFLAMIAISSTLYISPMLAERAEADKWLKSEVGTSVSFEEISANNESGDKVPVLTTNSSAPIVFDYLNADGVIKLSIANK